EAVIQDQARDFDAKAAHAVPDIHDDPALPRFQDLGADAAIFVQRTVGMAGIAVRQDVAGPHSCQDIFQVGRRRPDVDHHRQANAFGGGAGQFHRDNAVVTQDVARRPDLDALDDIAVLLDAAYRFLDVAIADVLQFPRENHTQDPDGGNVEIWQN